MFLFSATNKGPARVVCWPTHPQKNTPPPTTTTETKKHTNNHTNNNSRIKPDCNLLLLTNHTNQSHKPPASHCFYLVGFGSTSNLQQHQTNKPEGQENKQQPLLESPTAIVLVVAVGIHQLSPPPTQQKAETELLNLFLWFLYPRPFCLTIFGFLNHQKPLHHPLLLVSGLT